MQSKAEIKTFEIFQRHPQWITSEGVTNTMLRLSCTLCGKYEVKKIKFLQLTGLIQRGTCSEGHTRARKILIRLKHARETESHRLVALFNTGTHPTYLPDKHLYTTLVLITLHYLIWQRQRWEDHVGSHACETLQSEPCHNAMLENVFKP